MNLAPALPTVTASLPNVPAFFPNVAAFAQQVAHKAAPKLVGFALHRPTKAWCCGAMFNQAEPGAGAQPG